MQTKQKAPIEGSHDEALAGAKISCQIMLQSFVPPGNQVILAMNVRIKFVMLCSIKHVYLSKGWRGYTIIAIKYMLS